MSITNWSVPPWKIQRIVSKGDYNYAVVPDHPYAIKYGYVLEHRVVMENHLNRILESYEIVHHINGNKKDNRIENLQVMSNEDHAYRHSLDKGRLVDVYRCPSCYQIFERYNNQSYKNKNTRASFCSRSCSGRFSRWEQLNGLTEEMNKAISENLQRTYRRKLLDNSEETFETRVP